MISSWISTPCMAALVFGAPFSFYSFPFSMSHDWCVGVPVLRRKFSAFSFLLHFASMLFVTLPNVSDFILNNTSSTLSMTHFNRLYLNYPGFFRFSKEFQFPPMFGRCEHDKRLKIVADLLHTERNKNKQLNGWNTDFGHRRANGDWMQPGQLAAFPFTDVGHRLARRFHL